MTIRISRVYDNSRRDGEKRILVDRLWPRGISKDTLSLDLWARDLSPSNELRKSFAHKPEHWEEFWRRYRAELCGSAKLIDLLKMAGEGDLLLLYASREEVRNNASVLKEILENYDDFIRECQS